MRMKEQEKMSKAMRGNKRNNIKSIGNIGSY